MVDSMNIHCAFIYIVLNTCNSKQLTIQEPDEVMPKQKTVLADQEEKADVFICTLIPWISKVGAGRLSASGRRQKVYLGTGAEINQRRNRHKG